MEVQGYFVHIWDLEIRDVQTMNHHELFCPCVVSRQPQHFVFQENRDLPLRGLREVSYHWIAPLGRCPSPAVMRHVWLLPIFSAADVRGAWICSAVDVRGTRHSEKYSVRCMGVTVPSGFRGQSFSSNHVNTLQKVDSNLEIDCTDQPFYIGFELKEWQNCFLFHVVERVPILVQ